MGAKKQKLLAEAKEELNSGILSILEDASLSGRDRLQAACSMLLHVSCPASVGRSVIDWLLAQCPSEPAAAGAVAECLSSPGVRLALEEDPSLLSTLLAVAVRDAADAGRLRLDSLPVERLVRPAADAAARALRSPADGGAAALFVRLCERLAAAAPLRRPAGLRQAYLAELLVSSLRLQAARPELAPACLAVFEALALAEDDAAGALAALAAGRSAEPPESAAQLLNALQNLAAADAAVGAELLALLAGALLRRPAPLLAAALLASRLGLEPAGADGRPLLAPWGRLAVPPAELAPAVRLSLLGRLARCLREARLSLTVAAAGVTALQWLRAVGAHLLEAEPSRDAAWFDCAAELLRLSPLVLPLQSRLGQLLVAALAVCSGGQHETSAAASNLLRLVISTYAELHQLPRLLPQLLLAVRGQQRLRLPAGPCEELSGRVTQLPQQQVTAVWKTLLYHLTEDVITAMKSGAEPTDSASSVVLVTFQLLDCFLSHAAVVDQWSVTAASRAALPDFMTQTYEALHRAAALVTGAYSDADHVAGLLSACLAWRRLQSALLHYDEEYRETVMTSQPKAAAPLAPLGDKRWGKLAKLAAAEQPSCSQLMTDLMVEALRAAPEDWQPPPAGLSLLPLLDARLPGRQPSWETVRALGQEELAAALPLAGGAECGRLHVAVLALLARRLVALPAARKRKQDGGRPPAEVAAALLSAPDAVAAAGAAPLDSEPAAAAWAALQPALADAGRCLEAGLGWPPPSAEAAAGLEGALQLLAALPLEHLWPAAATLLLALLPLCLLVPDSGRLTRPALAALPPLLCGGRQWRPLNVLQPRRVLDWLAAARREAPAELAAPLQAATDAVLASCAGRRAAELAPLAESLAEEARQGRLGPEQLDSTVDLLRHYIEANQELKGTDPAVKQQAKVLSACLPRLLAGRRLDQLTGRPARAALAGWALLVQLRAHKPRSGRVQWRRQLAELYPAALRAAADPAAAGCLEAWCLLAAVCAARQHLADDLPRSLVTDAWRCARTGDVTVAGLRTVLMAADDEELALILSELGEETAAALPELEDAAGRLQRLLSVWRAVAESSVSESGRRLQRLSLHRLLAAAARAVALRPGWRPAELRRLLLPVLRTMTVVVQQKQVRLSDSAYTSCLLCCQPELSGVGPLDACSALQAVCELLYQLTLCQTAAVVGRLPLVAQVVRYVAQWLGTLSGGQRPGGSAEEQAALVTVANRLGRLVREIVQLGALSEALAPCMIADLLTQLQRITDEAVQESLIRSLYCLLTQCRDEVVTRLRITLPPSTQHLFHTHVANYKKFYKFTGRV